MKPIRFNPEKDILLKNVRGIGFEDIIQAMHDKKIVALLENPSSSKYSRQFLMLIELDGYIWVVPYVDSENKIFLKTIYKSRKYTKYYLK